MNKLLNSQNPLNNQVYDTIQVHSGGALSLLILFLLGAFVPPKGQIPVWWSWGPQISLLLYGFNALKRNGLGLQPSWGSPFSSMFCCTYILLESHEQSYQKRKQKSNPNGVEQ